MASTTYNFEVIKGSSFSTKLNLKNSDGSYINLSGYSARGYVKYRYSDSGYFLDLQPYIDPSYISGLIVVSGSGNATALLPVSSFVYDIEIFTSGNYVLKPIRGIFSILPESTW